MSAASDAQRHIRTFYGISVKRGMRIVFDGKPGRVTGFRGSYLLVRLDGEEHLTYPKPIHPTWRVAYPELGRAAMTE